MSRREGGREGGWVGGREGGRETEGERKRGRETASERDLACQTPHSQRGVGKNFDAKCLAPRLEPVGVRELPE